MKWWMAALVALSSAACGSIEQKTELSRPVAPGQTLIAGVGDAVIDLKLTQSLPNAFGRADVFGRTRSAGRIVVRYLGAQGERAYFARQDVLIDSNETTMSRSPLIVPNVQQSTMSGYVGTVPVTASQTTTGITYVPPAPVSSFATSSGQIQLSAPVGGSLYVEGKTVTILKIGDGSVEYSVQ